MTQLTHHTHVYHTWDFDAVPSSERDENVTNMRNASKLKMELGKCQPQGRQWGQQNREENREEMGKRNVCAVCMHRYAQVVHAILYKV